MVYSIITTVRNTGTTNQRRIKMTIEEINIITKAFKLLKHSGQKDVDHALDILEYEIRKQEKKNE